MNTEMEEDKRACLTYRGKVSLELARKCFLPKAYLITEFVRSNFEGFRSNMNVLRQIS